MRKDYYELLFNFSNLQKENEELKEQINYRYADTNTIKEKIRNDVKNDYSNNKSDNTTITENKFTRPHTAHTSILKTADDIFKSSIDGIKLFKLSHNPFLEDDDILDVDISNFKEYENSNLSKNFIKKDITNENYEEGDDLDELINQSMSDFNELKELNNEIKSESIKKEVIVSSNKVNVNVNTVKDKINNNKSIPKTKKVSPTNFLNEIIKKKDLNTKISKLPPLKTIKK